VEFGGHEEVQAQHIVELDAHAFEDESGGEHQYVNNQQVLCYCRNGAHNNCRIKIVLRRAKLRKISVTERKNGLNSTFFHEILHFFYFFV
jgi:hypothetical protein